MSLYIDISEFLTNPITTGIQRIAGEICQYAPPNTIIPSRLHMGGYIALPQTLIKAIGNYFDNPGRSELAEIRELSSSERGSRIDVLPGDTVLVPEVFDNPNRIAFFRSLSETDLRNYRFIVYDLLPVTHPEYFSAEGLVPIYQYFRLLQGVPHCGFISEYTRDVYYGRLKRTTARGGVVLPLGCDALGGRPKQPFLNRPLTFSVLGTIEPRKNHRLILEAFEPLLKQVEGLTLLFIGKMGWVDSELAQRVTMLSADRNSGLQFISTPGDDEIRRHVEQSRATIYISAAEGYGLPPVESLWIGTPVIASTTIPSLERLGSQGVHYVEPLNVVNLRRAILAFLDDSYANKKTEETLSLNLPTWRSFTQEVLRWCTQD